MEVYAGLFLVSLGTSFLAVRYFKSRFHQRVVKDRKMSAPSGRRPAGGKRQTGRAGMTNPAHRREAFNRRMERRRSAPMTAEVLKPWGW